MTMFAALAGFAGRIASAVPGRARTVTGAAVALAVLAVIGAAVPDYFQGELTRLLAMALFAVSLDLLLGFGGLFSLGHAAFLGAGGYAVGMLLVRFAVRDFWVAAAAAVVTAALLGAVYGAVALRVRGTYFLLITFALAQLVFVLATVWGFLSPHGYGSVGITGVFGATLWPLGISMSGTALYAAAALALVGSVLLVRRFLASPLGLTLRGTAASEVRMNALGYRPVVARYIAFVVASAMAGLAGALVVFHDGIATPALFGVDTSTLVVLMVLIGGAGTLYGPLVGASIVVLAEYFISGLTPQRWPLILGALFVAAVMFASGGIWPLLRRLTVQLAGPPAGESPASTAEPPIASSTMAPAVDIGSAGPPSAEIALSATNLVKRFRGMLAVDDVSISVHRGERLAVIGTNGAGKSTLFNLIGGALRADAGTVTLHTPRGASDLTHLPVRARARLGISRSFQINTLFADLTVAENLWLATMVAEPWHHEWWRPLRNHADTAARVDTVLATWDLDGHAQAPAGTLPYGDQRRLEIAMALAARPRLLLLDEPTAGLSRQESIAFAERLRELGRGVTVLLIAHDPELVFAVADRVIVMHQGRIVAEGTGDEVRGNEIVRQLYMAGSAAGDDV